MAGSDPRAFSDPERYFCDLSAAGVQGNVTLPERVLYCFFVRDGIVGQFIVNKQGAMSVRSYSANACNSLDTGVRYGADAFPPSGKS